MDDELQRAVERVGATRLRWDDNERVLEHRDPTGVLSGHTTTAMELQTLLQLMVLLAPAPPSPEETSLEFGLRLLLHELDRGRWAGLSELHVAIRTDLRGTLAFGPGDVGQARELAC